MPEDTTVYPGDLVQVFVWDYQLDQAAPPELARKAMFQADFAGVEPEDAEGGFWLGKAPAGVATALNRWGVWESAATVGGRRLGLLAEMP